MRIMSGSITCMNGETMACKLNLEFGRFELRDESRPSCGGCTSDQEEIIGNSRDYEIIINCFNRSIEQKRKGEIASVQTILFI